MDSERFELQRPVFFIGFMGAGKTTLTRRLARNLGLASVDIDRCIERNSGRKIKQLYSEVGDEAFRQMEADTLEDFAAGDPLLISCGGGVVVGERSRRIIGECGLTIYLKVSPDESAERISNHATRPFFDDMDTVRQTSEERLPLYDSLADVVVDTTGKSVGLLAAEVKKVLLEEGVLCPVRK